MPAIFLVPGTNFDFEVPMIEEGGKETLPSNFATSERRSLTELLPKNRTVTQTT